MTTISNREVGLSIRQKFNANIMVKNNFSATTNPAVDDDGADGYEVGSRWINISADTSYTCVDASNGAAVWVQAGTATQIDSLGTRITALENRDVGGRDFTDLEDFTNNASAYSAYTTGQTLVIGNYDYTVVDSSLVANAHLTASSGVGINVGENNPVVTLSAFGGVCDDSTDNTDILNTALTWAEERGGATIIANQDSPGLGYKFDGSIRFEGSNIKLIFEAPVKYGANARLAMQGTTAEFPNGTEIDRGYFELRYPAGLNDSLPNRLYLRNGDSYDTTNFSVGDFLVLRGENDAQGIAIEKEEAFVASVVPGIGADSTTNYLVLDRNLSNRYEVEYPLSESPSTTDKTTIAKIISGTLLSDANYNDSFVTIDSSQTSNFGIGDYISIQDLYTQAFYNGTLDSLDLNTTNYPNWNPAIITNIDSALGKISFNSPLSRGVSVANSAVVAKVLPVRDNLIQGMNITYDSTPTESNRWAIWLSNTYNSTVRDITIRTPERSTGHATHVVRCGENSVGNLITGINLERVADSAGGFGYGVTFYKGAKFNTLSNSYFDGARHSLLEFLGASNNLITNNISVNCLNSDFDAHNGGEVGSVYLGNTARYSTRSSADVGVKSGFRIGNPAHLEGTRDITMIGNVAENFPDGHYAFDIQVPATGFALIGNRAVNCNTFLRAKYNARADGNLDSSEAIVQGLAIENGIVKDNTMTNGQRFVEIDGGPLHSVRNILFQNNVSNGVTVDKTNLNILAADDIVFRDYTVSDVTLGTTTDLFYFDSCVDLRMSDVYVDSAEKLIRVIDCGASKFNNFEIHGLTFRTILNDIGNNDNTQMSFRAYGFNPRVEQDSFPSTGMRFKNADTFSRRVKTDLVAGTYGNNDSAGTGGITCPSIDIQNETPGDSAGVGGLYIFNETFNLKSPGSKLEMEVNIPYVATSGSTNLVMLNFIDSTFTHPWVVKMNSGAATGDTVSFRHVVDVPSDLDTNTAHTIKTRIGLRDTSPNFDLGSKFGGYPYTQPQLSLTEIYRDSD